MIDKPKHLNSFRKLNTCLRCKHVWEDFDYEMPIFLYCTFDAPPRPKSRRQGWRKGNDWQYDKKRWDEWAEGRMVLLDGTCDNFEETDKWFEDLNEFDKKENISELKE